MGLREQVAEAQKTTSVVRSGDATSPIWRTVKTNYLHKCAREQGLLLGTGYKVSTNKTTDQHRSFYVKMQETLHEAKRQPVPVSHQKSQDPGYQGLASDSHKILVFSHIA